MLDRVVLLTANKIAALIVRVLAYPCHVIHSQSYKDCMLVEKKTRRQKMAMLFLLFRAGAMGGCFGKRKAAY